MFYKRRGSMALEISGGPGRNRTDVSLLKRQDSKPTELQTRNWLKAWASTRFVSAV